MKLLILMLLLFTGANACQQDAGDDQGSLPENLDVQVEKIGNGKVRVNFSATSANFFRVGFGRTANVMERVDGHTAVHTYTTPGEYVIVVQAHTTEEKFISSTSTVEITEGDMGMPIPTTGFESPAAYMLWPFMILSTYRVWAQGASNPVSHMSRTITIFRESSGVLNRFLTASKKFARY